MFISKQNKFDIAVIGGGHAGLTTTAILAKAGFNVACIDLENPKDYKKLKNNRTTAISYGSSKVLEQTDAWNSLLKQACPIKDIKILDGSRSPVYLDFLADQVGHEAFGWIVDNIDLKIALHTQIKKLKSASLFSQTSVEDFKITDGGYQISLSDGQEIEAGFIIGADGRRSFTRQKLGINVRQWSYDQTAIVSIIHHEKPHNNIAIEHFYKEGPFAILPMLDGAKGNHRSSIVWSEENKNPKSILEYDDETFILALKTRFPEFYGDILGAGKRLSYPLNFIHASSYISHKAALVADAAHGIHPIAGQGLNIGLRDIDVLCDLMIKAKNNDRDWGSEEILKSYEQKRRIDNMSMAGATDYLNSLFASPHQTVQLGRKIGLKLVSKIKPAKEFFMRRAMGE